MRKILTIISSSFTLMMLLFTFFEQFDLSPTITSNITIQVLIISTTIAICMEISDKLQSYFKISSTTIDIIIRILICYIVVFTACVSFDIVSFSLIGLWKITPTLLLCFPLTYFYTLYMNNEITESINRVIKERNKVK